jgi:hypothetical protein
LRAKPAKSRGTRILSGALLLLFLPLLLQAGELFSGRIYTTPKKIFVNQPFDIFMEVEISSGENIDNIRIQGFPNNPSFITLGQLEQEQSRRNRTTKEGQLVDVLTFKANARCHKSISQKFNPILSCNVVQRRSRSFFSFSSSSPHRVRIAPFNLKIHQLPLTGQPKNFSGAIGQYTLKGNLSKTRVRPGDIITLKLDLIGKGWLNNCAMPAPAIFKEFKSYPTKEILRQSNRITTEQIFIPVSTNATELAAAHFSYFNPKTESYEECSSPRFKLEFLSAENSTHTNQVKIISTDTMQAAMHTPAVSINIREVNAAFHQILPIAIGGIFILTGSFIFIVLLKVNKWVATTSLIITLAAGAFLTFKAVRYEPAAQSKLAQQATVYLAPTSNSPVIMELHASTLVTPLESAGHWVRIESANQRGWIEQNLIEDESAE